MVFDSKLIPLARRAAGNEGLDEAVVCAVGLAVGCKVLRKKLEAAGGDLRKDLQEWNGGANPDYADEVLARVQVKMARNWRCSGCRRRPGRRPLTPDW